MNFVSRGGGWKGKKPEWDTADPIKELAFSKELDDATLDEMDSLTQRLKKAVWDKCQKSTNADGKDGWKVDNGIEQTWLDIE